MNKLIYFALFIVLVVARTAVAEEPLTLTVEGAILTGLENNRSLKVERITPEIRQTVEGQERAVFDPVLRAGLARSDREEEDPAFIGVGITNTTTKSDTGVIALETILPTGTRVAIEANSDLTESSLVDEDFDSTRAGLSVTQSLLKGGRREANLASLQQARIDTLASQYELRGFAEALVAQIENAYWDCLLAQRQIEIVTESLKLAEQQLSDLRERIRIGSVGAIEESAAAAEVASRQENLINAQSALESRTLQFLRLVSPSGSSYFNREIILIDPLPPMDPEPEEVENRVQLAMKMRPDLNQARLNIQRGDLEIVKTKNGLLPRLDLFVNLGRTGYADSFDQSVRDIPDDGYDTVFGVEFEYALGNRDARSQQRRAMLSREQSLAALENLEQLAEYDVRAACIEVRRSREQVAATATTSTFREDALKAETEKFSVGKSTALLVAQTQRDLLESQIIEARAAAGYRKALVDLYRLEGSLLMRRGLVSPGSETIELDEDQ